MSSFNNQPKNGFFNFRITDKMLNDIKELVTKIGYPSIAEFIRSAIREKINRHKGREGA